MQKKVESLYPMAKLVKRTLVMGSLLLGYCLMVSIPAVAQWHFSGQTRARAEFRRGYRTLPNDGAKGATFISQRSRLAGRYTSSKKTQIFFQIQDVRVWGQEQNTLTDFSADNLDIHQFFGEISPSAGFILRVGRQELAYDGHRILGNVNWTQQARAHDAVVAMYEKGKHVVHLGVAYNAGGESLFDVRYPIDPASTNYRKLAFLWAKRKMTWANVTVMALYDAYRPRKPKFRWTLGPRIEGRWRDWPFRGEAYYQLGAYETDIDIAAVMANIRVGYAIDPITVTLWYDFLSGDSDAMDDQFKAFDTPYPTNHKFYGWADYFLNIPKDTQNHGLQDLAVKLNWRVVKSLTANFHVHNFRYAVADVQADKNLGIEVDIAALFAVTDGVKLSGGYSRVNPTSALKRLKGGDRVGHWIWTMLDFAVQ